MALTADLWLLPTTTLINEPSIPLSSSMCIRGQNHIRILSSNMHGMSSSAADIATLINKKENNLFCGFECIAKNSKDFGAPLNVLLIKTIQQNKGRLLQLTKIYIL